MKKLALAVGVGLLVLGVAKPAASEIELFKTADGSGGVRKGASSQRRCNIITDGLNGVGEAG